MNAEQFADIVILDTSVVSYLLEKKEIGRIYDDLTQNTTRAISIQTFAELWYWALKRNWGENKKNKLFQYINQFLIIELNVGISEKWAEVSLIAEKQGYRLETADCWIAATAAFYNIPLVTHDRDFINVKIPDLNIISALDE